MRCLGFPDSRNNVIELFVASACFVACNTMCTNHGTFCRPFIHFHPKEDNMCKHSRNVLSPLINTQSLILIFDKTLNNAKMASILNGPNSNGPNFFIKSHLGHGP